MIKSLFIATGLRMGGAQFAIFYMMQGLKKYGVEPHIIISQPHLKYVNFISRLIEKGVKIHMLKRVAFGGLLYWLIMAVTALYTILKERIDVLHANNPKNAFILGLLAKLTNRPLLYTVEGEPIYELEIAGMKRGLKKLIIMILWYSSIRLADVICPCSKWLGEVIKKNYPMIKDKVKPIHNPVDTERFCSKVEDESKIVITVAALERVKSIDTLLKAVKIVLKEQPDVKFLIAGEGSLKGELINLAHELGIDTNVNFIGFHPNVQELISKSIIGILPSIYEPFGMAAAEYGACGKPAIVSNAGGLKEIVVDGVTGFIFPKRNHEALAKAILKLILNKELRKRMGIDAQNYVRKNFSVDAIAYKYSKVYFELHWRNKHSSYTCS
ncbi:MAG: glycosyltransferase family 4 protein [Nitrososphaerota archaeon]|nr:glycosyltransferase family 4 protein [Nitrososphaerota archaeon]